MGLLSIFRGSKNVFFPGCSLYFKHKSYLELYLKIFNKLGIDFKIPEKKICCGLPAFELGYDNEARKIARRNFEIFKEMGANTIITTDPGCQKMFFIDYPNLIPDWNLKIENIWQIILNKIESKPGLIKNKVVESVTFQDSCYLGRYLNIYNEPRKILEFIGYEIIEMSDSFENSVCAGSCGQLNFTNPILSDQIARERILQAKRTGVKKLVTCSLSDYEILKKNAKEDIDVVDISEIISHALGIGVIKEEDIKDEIEEEEFFDKLNKELENEEVNEVLGVSEENDR